MKVFVHVMRIIYFEEVAYETPYQMLDSDFDIFHVNGVVATNSEMFDLVEGWVKENVWGVRFGDSFDATAALLSDSEVEYRDVSGTQCKLYYDFYEKECVK